MLGIEAGVNDLGAILKWSNENWVLISLVLVVTFLVYVIHFLASRFVVPWVNEKAKHIDTICSLAPALMKIAEEHPKFQEYVKGELVTIGGDLNDLRNITNGIGNRMSMYEEDRDKTNKTIGDHNERFVKLETKMDILIQKL